MLGILIQFVTIGKSNYTADVPSMLRVVILFVRKSTSKVLTFHLLTVSKDVKTQFELKN